MQSHKEDLERILAPNYLDGMSELSLEHLRAMRSECQQIEVALSYLRRLIQGRLDIVFTYIQHPGTDASLDLATVVDDLPGILSTGTGRSSSPARLPMLLAPDTEEYLLTAELDEILPADQVASLATRDSEDLQGLAAQLEGLERLVSTERRGLHERIDALQAELVTRYKTGQASVDGLLQ